MADISQINAKVIENSQWVGELKRQVGKVIIGQEYLIDRLVAGLLANGHVLLEGVPGLAKTMCVRVLSEVIDSKFQRIQFTPDLLPADIVGTLIYNPVDGNFQTKKGPVFSNLLLADEINRAPAKVQSALLEAMQERQVTLGDTTYPLPQPFLVMATQNPIDQEGTYPLPEAQVDRFMFKLSVDYPSMEEERLILEQMATTSLKIEVSKVITSDKIVESRKIVDEIYLDDKIKDYIVNIVIATRQPERFNLDISTFIKFGASPRATIALALAAKAWAFMRGRGYVVPQDIKDIAHDVLRHRIIITYEAEAEEISSDDIITKILSTVAVP